MEQRAAITIHFKLDPAKQTLGLIELPNEITKTISFGDEIEVEKIAVDSLPLADKERLEQMISKQVSESVRTAKTVAASKTPSPTTPAEETSESTEEEGMSLF